MPDDPSPRELDRRMDDMRDEMRRGFSNLNTRLDRVPTSELLMAHLASWQNQLDSVKSELNDVKAEREADRRRLQWLVSGVLVPLAASLLALAAAFGVIG